MAANAERTGAMEKARAVVASTKGAVTKGMRKASGVEFRENWQEFSEAVTTIVVGLNAENQSLRAEVDLLKRTGANRTTLWVSILALVVAIVALALVFVVR